jgi:hypothetical protein
MSTFPLKFQLKDNTDVKVSNAANNSFDFDIVLPDGSKRTFRWRKESPHVFFGRHGEIDEKLKETIELFLEKINGNNFNLKTE